jgi:hypothetical protein
MIPRVSTCFLVALPPLPVWPMHVWLQASGMNMVVKAGSTSVLLRDALRRPLAELELSSVKAGLRSLPKGVTQVLCPAYAHTHIRNVTAVHRHCH